MNQIGSVSFWIGLISSIVGIVLSLVAIVFSILVDRRSSTISDRTIQSLQKIESAVERSSSDTRELIKAGWDKMLGNVDRGPTVSSNDSSAKEVAAGFAAELRTELKALNPSNVGTDGETKQKIEQLEKYIKNLEASLVAQLKNARSDARPSAKLDEIIESVRQLSDTSFALLRGIRRHHLTQTQYRNLSSGRFGSSLLELRRSGLLAPVVHETNHGPEPCYYMPPSISSLVHAAMQVLPRPKSSLINEVNSELKKIGYLENGSHISNMN